MLVHYKIIVQGIVQGVSYRASTQLKAKELSLVGSVKNQNDGSVIIFVQGDENVVNQLIGWCRIGPVNARVENMKLERQTELGDYEGFMVLF